MSIHILSPVPKILHFVELLITEVFSMAIYVMLCLSSLPIDPNFCFRKISSGALIQDGSAISGSIRTFFLLKLLGWKVIVPPVKLIITYQSLMIYWALLRFCTCFPSICPLILSSLFFMLGLRLYYKRILTDIDKALSVVYLLFSGGASFS